MESLFTKTLSCILAKETMAIARNYGKPLCHAVAKLVLESYFRVVQMNILIMLG